MPRNVSISPITALVIDPFGTPSLNDLSADLAETTVDLYNLVFAVARELSAPFDVVVVEWKESGVDKI